MSGSRMRNDYQVLIVGAGPVGALCGLLLGNYGVRTLIVERTTDVVDTPRAISLDNEALRVLQAADVLDQLREDMPAVPAGEMVSPYVGDLMQFDTRGVLDGHPKLVSFFQPGLERVLRAALARHPSVELREGMECMGLTEDDSGVALQCRSGDGEGSSVRADYVIAADGATSFVRSALNIAFTGSTYPQDWLIVDVASAPGGNLEHARFFCYPDRPHVHVPGPGGSQRWEFMMMPGETREQLERPEMIRALLAPWGDVSQMRVLRTAVYRFHARTADRIRCGRVMLAGDSAHITPPFAGQGLCSGMRDAHNLSWKLAWVLRGQARDSILDSYEQERLPHVRGMIRLAVRIGRIVMPTNRLYVRCRDHLIRWLRLLAAARRSGETREIRPDGAFVRGLFLSGHPRRSRIRPGTLLPQGILRRPDGALAWSDDLLGSELTLIGCGVDPRNVVDADTLQAWHATAGTCAFLRARQQNLAILPAIRSRVLEDEAGTYTGGLTPIGTLIIVRPDRIVLGVAAGDDGARMVRAAIALLRGADERYRSFSDSRLISAPSTVMPR